MKTVSLFENFRLVIKNKKCLIKNMEGVSSFVMIERIKIDESAKEYLNESFRSK